MRNDLAPRTWLGVTKTGVARKLASRKEGEPYDDIERERGGAPGGQRDPRPHRVRRRAAAPSTRCPSRPSATGTQARRGALAAVPPIGEADATGGRGGRPRAGEAPALARGAGSRSLHAAALADVLEAGLTGAVLQLAQPEGLERPERAGAVDALGGGAARGPGQQAAVSAYGSTPDRWTSASRSPAAS